MTSRISLDETPTAAGPDQGNPAWAPSAAPSVVEGLPAAVRRAVLSRASTGLRATRRVGVTVGAIGVVLALAACSPSGDSAGSAAPTAEAAAEATAATDAATFEPETTRSLADEAEVTAVDDAVVAEQVAAYADVIREFAETLQGHLQTAMAEGGPGNAIEVCSRVAPDIAASISEARNLEIGRTSLRVRNTANEPDQWERLVLEGFENARADGQEAQSLRHHDVVIEDGQPVLRYMQAIPTGGLCLTCHGAELHADVRPALERLYPEDRAVGFAEGDVRGAFTIRQRM